MQYNTLGGNVVSQLLAYNFLIKNTWTCLRSLIAPWKLAIILLYHSTSADQR